MSARVDFIAPPLSKRPTHQMYQTSNLNHSRPDGMTRSGQIMPKLSVAILQLEGGDRDAAKNPAE
jgi:hypothetical protein